MRIFETKVQKLKYRVIREVARRAFEDRLEDCYPEIPQQIVPGPHATMRCCIYKERAIVTERIRLAMGGNRKNPNVIEVIDIACDECPVTGYTVGEYCRGCIAHRCKDVCPTGAISIVPEGNGQRAVIDKSKCVECGRCASVCPFSAITNRQRPCQKACKIKAITMNEDNVAVIDNQKCIACGACSYQCPFGAISDKSFVLQIISLLKNSQNNTRYRVHAVVAPSISSQFTYARLGQVIAGIRALGFASVQEAALGADMVAYHEAAELAEKGFLTSSCCPAFVDYTQKNFPGLKDHISRNLSPMATIAKRMKELDPDCKIVFIGPCTAKKAEIQREEVRPYVDSAMTFSELQALFDARNLDIASLPEESLDTASYFGRIFARSGGVADAVAQALCEQKNTGFVLKSVPCDGIEACRTALLKASKNLLDGNFIEGMACVGGCIGGAGCISHGAKDRSEVDTYGHQAQAQTITEAIENFEANNQNKA